jgi:hypothetical protein
MNVAIANPNSAVIAAIGYSCLQKIQAAIESEQKQFPDEVLNGKQSAAVKI